jgi:outer membrane protein assembly factor BamA
LTIEGLDIHTEPVIRKLWALKEGQPYNNEYPDLFLNRVREQGVFDNLGKTSAKINVNEKSRAVDVTLRFEGAPPPKKEPFR